MPTVEAATETLTRPGASFAPFALTTEEGLGQEAKAYFVAKPGATAGGRS